MYAEQVMRPTEARTHGAGLLLAESLIGINHRLHSRAAAVLPLMLQEDILTPADLKVSFSKHCHLAMHRLVDPLQAACSLMILPALAGRKGEAAGVLCISRAQGRSTNGLWTC